MWFNIEELKLILLGKKRLTIRCYTKNGRLPIKVGTKTYLKTGSFTSKERYGQILITGVIAKPLGEMTEAEAKLGGYNSAEDYIQAQMGEFNEGVTMETVMLFYTFEIISLDSDLINSL